jgi:hypothetical protein
MKHLTKIQAFSSKCRFQLNTGALKITNNRYPFLEKDFYDQVDKYKQNRIRQNNPYSRHFQTNASFRK